MIITVESVQAWRVAQACTNKKDYGLNFRGLYVRPDGFLAGTDGFRAAYHSNGVEPFDGKELIIIPDKKLPANVVSVNVDTDTKILTARTKQGKVSAMSVQVIEEPSYVNVERVTPEFGRKLEDDLLGVNAKMLNEIVTALEDNKYGSAFLQLSGPSAPARIITNDPELVILLMPVKTDSVSRPAPTWSVPTWEDDRKPDDNGDLEAA